MLHGWVFDASKSVIKKKIKNAAFSFTRVLLWCVWLCFVGVFFLNKFSFSFARVWCWQGSFNMCFFFCFGVVFFFFCG